jgi:hypothetical protein
MRREIIPILILSTAALLFYKFKTEIMNSIPLSFMNFPVFSDSE